MRNIWILLLLSCSFLHAQKPDSVQINGSYYFVYPYPQEADLHWELKELIQQKMDKQERYKWIASENPHSTAQQIEEKMKAKPRLYTRRLNKVIGKHADVFYNTNFLSEKDFVPALDSLPDGKYVQYYSGYYKLNQKKQFVPDPTKIAGFFELKNNLPEGKAYWINMLGDTVKSGAFHHGNKEGEWKLLAFRHSSYFFKRYAQKFLKSEAGYDTSTYLYKNGLLNGRCKFHDNSYYMLGSYKDGQASGEWFHYWKYSSGVQLIQHYTLPENNIKSHKPFVRSECLNHLVFNDDLTDPCQYPAIIDLRTMRTVDQQTEINQTLNRNRFINRREVNYYSNYIFSNQKWIHKSALDSLGYFNKYDGIYEEFYPNGQLMLRLKFENGDLVMEDTLFSQDGIPIDVVVYDAAKKEYENRLYDCTGQLTEIHVYDSMGVYASQRFNLLQKDLLIEGLETKLIKNAYLEYGTPPFNPGLVEGETLLYKSWYLDTSKRTIQSYNPTERMEIREMYSRTGKLMQKSRYEFDPKFKTVLGNKIHYLKDLSTEIQFNGAYEKDEVYDSLAMFRILYPDREFKMTSDYVVKYKDEPFNGKIIFSMNHKSLDFVMEKNKIQINLPEEDFEKKLDADYTAYLQTGKTKYQEAQDFSSDNNPVEGLREVFPFLWDVLPYGLVNSQFTENPLKKMEGQMRNGKPEGTWRIYDMEGKVMDEFSFANGELNGNSKFYDYAYPYDDYQFERDLDTFPTKRTHYLYYTTPYKHGVVDGREFWYNWQGNITGIHEFKNGKRSGTNMDREKNVTVLIKYTDGELDGVSRAILHGKNKDSLVLSELNFNNGRLNGESRSYHPNGKLSRKGFFLNGQPIDTYEAYGTDGKLIHSIEFKYTFPVEEKIWDTGEITVKYEFDWKDSIYFDSKFTNRNSLSTLLIETLRSIEGKKQPQLSLVNKAGISYRITKYFPNGNVARKGTLSTDQQSTTEKTGLWQYFNYEGELFSEVNYFDSTVVVNDTLEFNTSGVHFAYNKGKLLSKSYLIEKSEKYDCANSDHYEIRQFYTFWQVHDSVKRINGFVKNHYDNGVLQSEGNMQNGLPTGIWKYYDPFGKLNEVGEYKNGKREGRWLKGDLSKTKYLGDICMNPNLPDLEERIKYNEKLLDIQILYLHGGKVLKSESYNLNLNEGSSEIKVKIQEKTPEKPSPRTRNSPIQLR